MQGAAESWLRKDFINTLDKLNQSKELLNDNMPLPSDKYAWACFATLKTYCLLLMRLAEIDYFNAQKKTSKAKSAVRRISKWADDLNLALTKWADLELSQKDNRKMRDKWVMRISNAVKRARKVGEDR